MNSPKYLIAVLSLLLVNASIFAQHFNMDGTPIMSCSGFFHDSGGASAPYGLNENFTTTICSDGSGDTHIRLLFSGIDLDPGDSFRVYDSPIVDENFAFDLGFLLSPDDPFLLQATAVNPSGCLTIVFTSDGIDNGGTGWDAVINCIPICQTIEAVLTNTIPSAVPVDTGWIDICPGDEVFFEGIGNYLQNNEIYIQSDLISTFEWDFGDGTREEGKMVSHVFENPGGYTVQLTITDDRGCSSTNFINQRVRVSSAPIYNIDDLLDFTICLGDTIEITSSVNVLSGSDVIAQANPQNFAPVNSVIDTVFLPDGVGTFYESSIFFTQFEPGATLENVNDLLGITLDLEHSFYGDLDIELICPDGTSINLLDNANTPNGRGSTNFGEPWASAPSDTASPDTTRGDGYLYTFVNSSPNGTLANVAGGLTVMPLITDTSTMTGDVHQYSDRTFPAGEYQSDTPFSNLLGCPLNGQWTIRVTDHLSNDNGWLYGWEIDFAQHLFDNLEAFTPELVNFDWEDGLSIITHTPDLLVASPENAGEAQYTFWTRDAFGCRFDTTLTYNILPSNHPDCIDCTIQINEQPDLLSCQGDALQLDLGVTTPLEECVVFQQSSSYTIGAANHPSNTPYASILTVNSIHPDTIRNPSLDICTVCVDLSTDNLSDIRLVLESPSGQQIVLIDMLGGNSDLGLVNTCFSPTALTEIVNGVAPFTGSFQPQEDWGVFNNNPINGNWTLWISDCCDLTQEGTLLQWSISFNSVNEYTYLWENNSDLSCLDCDNPTATPIVSNSYHLSITDSYGCLLEDTVNVQIIEELPAPVVSCNTENNGILFNWTSPSPQDSFEYRLIINNVAQMWIGPFTGNSLFINTFNHNDVVSFEVRLFIDDQNLNCNAATGSTECTAFVCDTEVDSPTLTPASCFNISDGSITINVTAGTMPYTYQISGSSVNFTSPMITGLAPGDYTYTVINGDGCDLQRDFTIEAPDSLFVDINQTSASCFGTDKNIAVAIGGGGSGAGYTYSWSNGQTGAEQNSLSTDDYQVTVMDSNNCEAINNGAIASLDSINFNFLTNPPSCFGLNDGGVGINQISGGAGLTESDYQLTWEDGSSNIVRTMLLGNRTYCVTVTDTQGCQAEQCRDLTEPPAPSLNLIPTPPTCQGDQDGEITISPPFQTGLFTIQWSPNTGGQTTQTASNLSAGTYAVTIVDIMDGCTATADTILINPASLDVDFTVTDNPCYNYNQGTITALATGGIAPYQYNWNTGGTSEMINNLVAGTYNLTLTDSNGCQIENNTTVEEPEEATVVSSANSATCNGDQNGSIEVSLIGGTPPFMYSLNNGAFTSNPFFLGLEAGFYTIKVTDNKECNFFATTEITQPPAFTIEAGPDIHINYGDSVQLTTVIENNQGNVMYLWNELYPGTLSCLPCQEPFASPEATIDYTVLAIDDMGCEAEDQFRLFVDKSYTIVVPTGFTPNNDNANDVLFVRGTPGIEILSFQVFDRWGEEVYAINDFAINDKFTGWNGIFRGKEMSAGVFVWQLQALFPDGSKKLLNGQTTLIR